MTLVSEKTGARYLVSHHGFGLYQHVTTLVMASIFQKKNDDDLVKVIEHDIEEKEGGVLLDEE